jgi:hypothetical protein
MKDFRGVSMTLALFLAAAGLMLAGCATGYTPENAPEMFPCVADDQLETSIFTGAELAEFSCSYKQWKGSETLHFKVAVKNRSASPQRFRVNIFLDNGKAVGGLIPRKTKGGLVKPGQTASFVYPVKGMTRQPKSVMLKISTVSE